MRRLLLMIPTLFGIMLVSFVIVQFAPGGPVERVIAQLSGSDTGATSRIPRSAGGDFGARGAPGRSRWTPRRRSIAAPRASIPNSSRSSRRSSASTSRPTSASSRCCGTIPRSISARAISATSVVLQLIREKLPVSISLGLWMTLAVLRDLDPARHPQGGDGRLALRRLDLRHRHRRLRHSGLPVRDPADRPVRRRLVLATCFRCAA